MSDTPNEATLELLSKRLSYDPATGLFRWRFHGDAPPKWMADNVGKRAGHIVPRLGIEQVTVNGIAYPSHRLAWLFISGSWPATEPNHRNGVRFDNRRSNLTLKSVRLPGLDLPCKGVTQWRKKWRAVIMMSGTPVHIGLFDTYAQAVTAYMSAEGYLKPKGWKPETD